MCFEHVSKIACDPLNIKHKKRKASRVACKAARVTSKGKIKREEKELFVEPNQLFLVIPQ